MEMAVLGASLITTPYSVRDMYQSILHLQIAHAITMHLKSTTRIVTQRSWKRLLDGRSPTAITSDLLIWSRKRYSHSMSMQKNTSSHIQICSIRQIGRRS